jgi:hypothetical protein
MDMINLCNVPSVLRFPSTSPTPTSPDDVARAFALGVLTPGLTPPAAFSESSPSPPRVALRPLVPFSSLTRKQPQSQRFSSFD